MLLIVGLGNPGQKYEGNRHNIGFMTLDQIVDMYEFGPWRERFSGLASEGYVSTGDGGRVKALLLKPQTFYNESGRSVQAALRFHKMQPDQVVVFHDEIDLAPGRLRMKAGGGHSGNNGIRSIIQHVSNQVRRARLGVGHPGHKDRVQAHVLSDFAKTDADWLNALLDACARALPHLAVGDDDRFQAEVMRLAPMPKADQSKRGGRKDAADDNAD